MVDTKDKEKRVYEIFDKSLKSNSSIIVAYSGGKDSTILCTLLYRWVTSRKNTSLKLTLLHNDTQSEIEPMEKWARKFLADYTKALTELGLETEVVLAKPKVIDTFYWRVIIRGYPAPTYNFRWCVELLKVEPTKAEIFRNGCNVVITGLRENESTARIKAMRKRYGGCPLGPSKCLAYYFLSDNDGKITKIAPMRDWENADVWAFLRQINDFDIADLLFLYGCEEARFGCWHCTLAKVQWGLHVLDDRYLYLDALRLLYRKISDLPELRFKKLKGYSRYGPLDGTARCMMLHLIKITEELTGLAFYGLDESKINDYSLRDILYVLEPTLVSEMISDIDSKLKPQRIVPFTLIKDLSAHKEKIRKVIPKLRRLCRNEKTERLAVRRGLNPSSELLEQLNNELK